MNWRCFSHVNVFTWLPRSGNNASHDHQGLYCDKMRYWEWENQSKLNNVWTADITENDPKDKEVWIIEGDD